MTLLCQTKNVKAYFYAGLMIAGLGLNSPAIAELRYNIAEVGISGGLFSQGFAINSSGQVTGISGTPGSGGEGHAFVTNSNGTSTDLGALHFDPLPPGDSRNDSGGRNLGGLSINASGQVVGNYISVDGFLRGFTTSSTGTIVDLGTFGGSSSFATGINDAGQITGSATTALGVEKTFITNGNGQLTIIEGVGDGGLSRGLGINASGRVTGFTRMSNGFYNGVGNDVFHGFVTNNSGQMADLGTLGGNNSFGNAINDYGIVTGSSEIESVYGFRNAFITDSNGQLINLDPLNERYSSIGVDINNAGQVIGQYQEKVVVYEYGRGGEVIGEHIEAGEIRNFVTVNGVMVDIDSLLVESATGWKLHGTPGVDLAAVTGINDAGQITGFGNYNGSIRGFILTPVTVPLPPALWLFSSALVGWMGVKRKCQIS